HRQVADGPEAAQHRGHADQAAHQVARQLPGAEHGPAASVQERQQRQQAEEAAEEGDLHRGDALVRCDPDRNGHQPEEGGAEQHQPRGLEERRRLFAARGGAHHVAPTIRGSGSRATPKRSCTDAAMPRASASSCAPVALPWLTSTSAWLAVTPASPSRCPFQPQASISHAAESLRSPSSPTGKTGRAGLSAFSAWACAAGTIGFLKKLPALPITAG